MKGFGVLDMRLSPTHCPGPCGLGTCIADLVGTGINDDSMFVIVFIPVLVAFAFRESTLGLLPILDSPIAVHSDC